MANTVEIRVGQSGGLRPGTDAVVHCGGNFGKPKELPPAWSGDGRAGAHFLTISQEEWRARAHTARYCVKELAQHNHMSVRTLQRHILALTGQRPHKWMRNFRMARAAELLADDSKVEWVTGEVGYVSRHHFARDFKKYWGYPPSEHARRVKLGAVRRSPALPTPSGKTKRPRGSRKVR